MLGAVKFYNDLLFFYIEIYYIIFYYALLSYPHRQSAEKIIPKDPLLGCHIFAKCLCVGDEVIIWFSAHCVSPFHHRKKSLFTVILSLLRRSPSHHSWGRCVIASAKRIYRRAVRRYLSAVHKFRRANRAVALLGRHLILSGAHLCDIASGALPVILSGGAAEVELRSSDRRSGSRTAAVKGFGLPNKQTNRCDFSFSG